MSPIRCTHPCAATRREAGLLPIGAAMLALCLALGAQAVEPSLAYTVQPGDKLIVLSREMLVRPDAWAEVARLNALPAPDVIRPGQTLNIPLRLLKYAPVSGRVVSVQGSVQQGSATAVVGSTVGEGARLQTGADSSAVIEMSDGSRIQLLPASLAEVIASREYVLRDANASGTTKWFSGIIRLSQGAVETLASKLGLRATPLQIQTPTTTVGVRGTRFRVAQENGASPSARAEVLEGQVRAENTAQQSGADLPKGTGAVIDPARKEVKVVPLLPAPDLGADTLNLTNSEARSWKMPTLAGAAAFRVQVASDSQFNRIVHDQVVTASTADLSGLPSGAWYLRARGIDAARIEGFDAQRQLVLADSLLVTDSLLSFVGGETWMNWSRTLSDGNAVQAESYSAEIATDPDMMHMIRQSKSLAGPFNFGEMRPGRYFIRVAAKGPTLARSKTYRFEIPVDWGTTAIDVPSALKGMGP